VTEQPNALRDCRETAGSFWFRHDEYDDPPPSASGGEEA